MPFPSLAELRRRAEALGIDPVPFGRSRRALLAAIEAAEAGRQVPAKMTRVATSLTQPVEIKLEDWPPR